MWAAPHFIGEETGLGKCVVGFESGEADWEAVHCSLSLGGPGCPQTLSPSAFLVSGVASPFSSSYGDPSRGACGPVPR